MLSQADFKAAIFREFGGTHSTFDALSHTRLYSFHRKMPRIEDDIKLDFKDVLIRPKRSTLKSRSQVSLDRTFTFKHSNFTWTGVPIMAANMYGCCREKLLLSRDILNALCVLFLLFFPGTLWELSRSPRPLLPSR